MVIALYDVLTWSKLSVILVDLLEMKTQLLLQSDLLKTHSEFDKLFHVHNIAFETFASTRTLQFGTSRSLDHTVFLSFPRCPPNAIPMAWISLNKSGLQ